MEGGWAGDGVLRQTALGQSVAEATMGERRDTDDGEPYAAEGVRIARRSRRGVHNEVADSTDEIAQHVRTVTLDDGPEDWDDRSARAIDKSPPPPRLTMALVYDFDGTLAPGNMQERQFIPDIGMTPRDFWAEVDRLSSENQADGVLMYMYHMLRKAAEAGVPVRLEDLREKGRWLEYFPGVLGWFRPHQ